MMILIVIIWWLIGFSILLYTGWTNDRAEQNLADALKRRKPELPKVGACYWCGEMTDGVFCGVECRDMWQKEQDARARNGR